MEPTLMHETQLDVPPNDHVLIHEWRAEQLRDLGMPRTLADKFADRVDWRAVAALDERGCPAELAPEIVR